MKKSKKWSPATCFKICYSKINLFLTLIFLSLLSCCKSNNEPNLLESSIDLTIQVNDVQKSYSIQKDGDGITMSFKISDYPKVSKFKLSQQDIKKINQFFPDLSFTCNTPVNNINDGLYYHIIIDDKNVSSTYKECEDLKGTDKFVVMIMNKIESIEKKNCFESSDTFTKLKFQP